MTPDLGLHLLGDFQIQDGDALVHGIDTPRLQSLLAYLLLHRDAPQARSHLAFIFWPDSTEAQARTNLRKQIYYLRNALPDPDQFLHTDAKTLQWMPDAPFVLDVAEFENALTQAEQAKAGNGDATPQASLEQALALYSGDLLPGSYDDWVLEEREQLSQRFSRAAEDLVLLLEEQRDYQGAIRCAQRLVRHDPLHEATYRDLMRLHALSGNRAQALRAYHTCATVLQRELGVEPSPATREAYERLMNLEAALAPVPDPVVRAIPLVGRDMEWAQLQSAWRSASRGRPQLVMLQGEPGMGKTRLGEELLGWGERQGVPVASATCYASEGKLAYGPVVSWLRSPSLQKALLSVKDVWLSEISRLLPELPVEERGIPTPGPLTESLQRQRLFEGLAQPFLVRRKLLLMVDDVQWCDGETLEWLPHLLHTVEASRRTQLLIVLTGRAEEPPNGGRLDLMLRDLGRSGQLAKLELGPLAREEVLSLAEKAAGRPLEQEHAADLYRETEGNPLFVIEMVRAGWLAQEREGMSTEPVASPTHRPLPPAVHEAIMARLAGLSSEARSLVGLAATIGREFTFDVLAHAYTAQEAEVGEELLVRALDELWQRRIIRERGQDAYDFSHGKIRDVAYADLSIARRRLYHRHVGDALEAVYAGDLDASSGQIAGHFELAGSPERALSFYTKAAEHAARINAYHNAEMLYARAGPVAERLGRPGDEIMELYSARGRMLEHADRYDAAIQVYRDLEALALERGDTAIQRAAIARLVTCYTEPNDAHDLECAQPLIERGLLLAREFGDHDTESWLLWSKMVGDSHYGTAGDAQKAGEAGAAIAREHGLQERLAYVLNDLALNLRLSGSWKTGQAYAEEARALFREQDNKAMLADNLNQQAWIDYLRLDFDSTLQHAAQSAEISREIENGWNLSMATLMPGLVRSASGEWGPALAALEESIRYGEEAGLVIALTLMPSELGRLLRTIGQGEQAWALHEKAHAVSLQRAPFLLRAVESQLAMDAFAAGQVADGQRWLQSVLAREPRGEIGTAWLVLADPARASVRAAEYTGDWDLALEMVVGAIQEAQRRRLPAYLPLLLHEQGRSLEGMQRIPEAEEKYREALATAHQNGLRPVQWRSHAALARLYQAQGLDAEARAEQESAATLIEGLAKSLPDPDQRDSFYAVPAVKAVLAPDRSAVETRQPSQQWR